MVLFCIINVRFRPGEKQYLWYYKFIKMYVASQKDQQLLKVKNSSYNEVYETHVLRYFYNFYN